ncbi:LPXTG cell wall anchor domain-containing protein [Leucobacter viscericola]|uniref:LPXTG cell wall anchor domain-containing protein n=1 Tax=Leucobacter viscericola TaxID=2714935 RepID=A0A6G7XE51_9MICO|nr:LPXTG cell wall anchor domain-containing protein [Leucobacter viscericola]QIK62890.1 LPXTG cell wall anchor domain-containing protein [Leucobacter viscericola]
MKFVKHAAVLVAASALVLTAGISAASANTEASTGSETGATEATTSAPAANIWIDGFKIAPSAENFTMSFSYTQALWGADSALKLGIYTADAPLDVTTWEAQGAGAAAAFPDAEQAMADLTQEVQGQGVVFRKSVEKTISFKPSGAYSVMLFDVNKDGARFLAGAKVDVTLATPAVPTFDAKTSTLTVPDSNEFTYQDATGKTWAPGPYLLVAPVKLTAVPNPGFAAAPEASTEWPEFAPEVKPAPEPKPEKEPGTDKDKTPGTDKDKNPSDETQTTGGGTPPVSGPNENQLSPALEGKVGAQPTAAAGAQVKIFVGTQFAGKEVDVYVFSEPTYLGRHLVDPDGNVTVMLPAGLTGSHRLAVYNGGELIGWNRIIIGESTDGSTGTGFVAGTVTTSQLATTGSDSTGTLALLAAGSVVLGAAGLVARRRARRSVA